MWRLGRKDCKCICDKLKIKQGSVMTDPCFILRTFKSESKLSEMFFYQVYKYSDIFVF